MCVQFFQQKYFMHAGELIQWAANSGQCNAIPAKHQHPKEISLTGNSTIPSKNQPSPTNPTTNHPTTQPPKPTHLNATATAQCTLTFPHSSRFSYYIWLSLNDEYVWKAAAQWSLWNKGLNVAKIIKISTVEVTKCHFNKYLTNRSALNNYF